MPEIMGAMVGIDVGGTSIHAVSLEPVQEKQYRLIKELSMLYSEGKRTFEQDIIQLEIIRKVGGDEISGIGIGIPGVLSEDKTTTFDATFLRHWEGKPIRDKISHEFGCEVVIDHDQVCLALGEAVYGGTTDGNFSSIGYGTGIAGAFIKREGGQTIVQSIQGDKEYEYFRDWDEDCGGDQVSAKFGKPTSQLTDAEWEEVMSKFGQHLHTFLSRPEIYRDTVVFSGGVAIKQFQRLQHVFSKLKREEPILAQTNFKLTKLGEKAGAFGATALLREDCKVVNN